MKGRQNLLTALVGLGALGICWSRHRLATQPRTTQSSALVRSAREGGFSFEIIERSVPGAEHPTAVFIGTSYPHASGAYKNRAGSPPLHIHLYSDEDFVILNGTMGYVHNGKEGILRQGDRARLPAGEPHTFWNADPDNILRQRVQDINTSGRFAPQLRFFEQFAGIAFDHGGVDHVNPLQLLLTLRDGGVELAVPYPARLFIRYVVCPFAELLGYRGSYPEYVLH